LPEVNDPEALAMAFEHTGGVYRCLSQFSKALAGLKQ
jgi:hypothetical protein